MLQPDLCMTWRGAAHEQSNMISPQGNKMQVQLQLRGDTKDERDGVINQNSDNADLQVAGISYQQIQTEN
jgi:hypothetical protein